MGSTPASEPPLAPPAIADIEAAARRIAPHAVKTPVLESMALNERVGGRLLIKAEILQKTGSFKFRGAYNRLSRLDRAARRAGVVAYSSGNHAQGVAAAARLLGIPALIVMPDDAPAVKIANTRAWGAEIVVHDRKRQRREDLAEAIAAERQAVIVPPYDHPDIIAGQGTVGLELAAQVTALDADLDAVLVPVGGGGLIAGCALALGARRPEAGVYAVEPSDFDDTRRSLASGRRQRNREDATSFCDALLAPTPGHLTFAINQERLAGGLAVPDDAVARAMAAAFTHLKLVLEPAGAVALAAALEGHFDCRGKTVAVVCSGGNVDAKTFAAALKKWGQTAFS
ncbi:MAG: threonine/serine dehydratase [Kiloniellales bacterium]